MSATAASATIYAALAQAAGATTASSKSVSADELLLGLDAFQSASGPLCAADFFVVGFAHFLRTQERVMAVDAEIAARVARLEEVKLTGGLASKIRAVVAERDALLAEKRSTRPGAGKENSAPFDAPDPTLQTEAAGECRQS